MEITESVQVYLVRRWRSRVGTKTSKVPTGVSVLLWSLFCDFDIQHIIMDII